MNNHQSVLWQITVPAATGSGVLKYFSAAFCFTSPSLTNAASECQLARHCSWNTTKQYLICHHRLPGLKISKAKAGASAKDGLGYHYARWSFNADWQISWQSKSSTVNSPINYIHISCHHHQPAASCSLNGWHDYLYLCSQCSCECQVAGAVFDLETCLDLGNGLQVTDEQWVCSLSRKRLAPREFKFAVVNYRLLWWIHLDEFNSHEILAMLHRIPRLLCYLVSGLFLEVSLWNQYMVNFNQINASYISI